MVLNSRASSPTEPCVWSDTIPDCEYRYKKIEYYQNDLTTVTSVYVEKFQYIDVLRNPSSTYYLSGSMDFQIGNWVGTMNFSGATTPSTYTASNGSQTITGTLDPSGVSQVVYEDSPTSMY